jgi:hypothetical protein
MLKPTSSDPDIYRNKSWFDPPLVVEIMIITFIVVETFFFLFLVFANQMSTLGLLKIRRSLETPRRDLVSKLTYPCVYTNASHTDTHILAYLYERIRCLRLSTQISLRQSRLGLSTVPTESGWRH